MNCYISDTHAFHSKIIKYSQRPFRTTEEMNEALASGINSVADRRDRVFHLGDFSFGPKNDIEEQLRNAKRFREMINSSYVTLVFGNHDRLRYDPRFTKLFERTGDILEVYDAVLKEKVVLCHYAMVVWNAAHHGRYHLYGHSHSTIEPWLAEHMSERRSMDVGVDNAAKLLAQYRPFISEEIAHFIGNKKGCSLRRW